MIWILYSFLLYFYAIYIKINKLKFNFYKRFKNIVLTACQLSVKCILISLDWENIHSLARDNHGYNHCAITNHHDYVGKIRYILPITGRVWRCNKAFMAIAIVEDAQARKAEKGRAVILRTPSPSRSCIYTGGVIHSLRAVPLRCIYTYTFPKRSSHRSVPSPRRLLSLPVLPPIFSLAAGTRAASHRTFSCTSRLHRAQPACIVRKDA